MVPLFIALFQAQTVALTPFTDDGGSKTRGSEPLVLPLVGAGGKRSVTIRVGEKAFRLWVVDGKGGRSMFVDRNGNGKADAGEAVALTTQTVPASDGVSATLYQGDVVLGPTVRFASRSFVSATKDPGFAGVRDRVMLMSQYGFLGTTRLGGKTMKIGIRGGDNDHATLFIDRDGDGRLGTSNSEAYALDQPFNIGGTTYRMVAFRPGARPSVAFAVSPRRVAEVPMPADLSVGKIVPSISGTTLAGKAVTFPKSWPGKIVLLDVWATWCGPCVAEMPFMKAAYAKHHANGFEIVSFSIDDPNTRGQVAAFTKAKGASWVQVYQGQGWKSPVCGAYNVNSIPFFLLVDGSTGRILATERSLRGSRLEPTIAAVLAKRRGA